ncbi:MAG: hypothetical protein AVDCRST_MAG11-3920, partial [uncultured Gemmatimonadaceae bacterium]
PTRCARPCAPRRPASSVGWPAWSPRRRCAGRAAVPARPWLTCGSAPTRPCPPSSRNCATCADGRCTGPA